MKNKLALVIAMLLVTLQAHANSERKDAARAMCKAQADAAYQLAEARDKGLSRKKAVALADPALRDFVHVIYDNDLNPHETRITVRTECMNHFFK